VCRNILVTSVIAEHRKCGFDFHFLAFIHWTERPLLGLN
jgi:hypothetical protein